MTQIDRIEAKLELLSLQMTTLLQALQDEEQQEPMLDLDGNELPMPGDENGML